MVNISVVSYRTFLGNFPSSARLPRRRAAISWMEYRELLSIGNKEIIY